jgi:SH3-like domain-containing protein
MPTLTDTARFRPTDPDMVVSASLACPVCLRRDSVQFSAVLAGYDPSVECRCSRCELDWCVYLAPDQALRFALMPTRI